MMYEDDDDRPSLRLRKKHQELADELGMTPVEYLDYRRKIDKLELERQIQESSLTPLEATEFIDLIDNSERLGYSKQFLSREDAEFLYDEVRRYENQNSYVELDEEVDEVDEAADRETMITTYVHTGIKYDFTKIGLTIYNVFGFAQTNYSNHPSMLDFIHEMFLYNHRTKEFRDLRDDDCTNISFLDE